MVGRKSDEATLISPSYAGCKNAAAGELEVLAINCSAELTGCSTKLTSSFPFEVHVVTSKAPPVDSVEVSAIVPLTDLHPSATVRFNCGSLRRVTHPLLVTIFSLVGTPSFLLLIFTPANTGLLEVPKCREEFVSKMPRIGPLLEINCPPGALRLCTIQDVITGQSNI